jgi:hypothetical protein
MTNAHRAFTGIHHKAPDARKTKECARPRGVERNRKSDVIAKGGFGPISFCTAPHDTFDKFAWNPAAIGHQAA